VWCDEEKKREVFHEQKNKSKSQKEKEKRKMKKGVSSMYSQNMTIFGQKH